MHHLNEDTNNNEKGSIDSAGPTKTRQSKHDGPTRKTSCPTTPVKLNLGTDGKRPVGRPKGSKNGPNAGKVVRPPKHGGPPKKRKNADLESGSNYSSAQPFRTSSPSQTSSRALNDDSATRASQLPQPATPAVSLHQRDISVPPADGIQPSEPPDASTQSSNRLLTATRDDNSGGLSSLMRGGCEENEGDEEVAVNCAPCTTASDLTGLPVDRLSDVGEVLSLMMMKIPSRLVMPDLRKRGPRCLTG
ncbi:hypothetical protein L208DRAFT_1463044 [Tricholoma matsutake]|nr:hypothetical protein L208DRAFT_1463044 [Tricholoma matsutake 945]